MYFITKFLKIIKILHSVTFIGSIIINFLTYHFKCWYTKSKWKIICASIILRWLFFRNFKFCYTKSEWKMICALIIFQIYFSPYTTLSKNGISDGKKSFRTSNLFGCESVSWCPSVWLVGLAYGWVLKKLQGTFFKMSWRILVWS